MCATYQLTFEDTQEIKNIADEITKNYGSDTAELCFPSTYYPKSEAPVIGPGNKASLLKWGFPMENSSQVIFNARAED
jgi:hypothetical protein